jgi:diguanylate cyclase (GGDEF)-like protein
MHIPVIFITGLRRPDDEKKGLNMGAVDYITKPVNVDIMLARVRTHLQIVKQLRMIEKIGMTDPLTEIANRRRFDQQLAIEWARAQREKTPVSLLIFDLDKFKCYNDAYGHLMGDAVLQKFAWLLKKNVYRSSDLPARVGGEEFAVILPNTFLTGAVTIGEKIRAALEALAIPSGHDPALPVTTSVGIATMTPDGENNITDLIAICDKNLYTAKKDGRNKIHY